MLDYNLKDKVVIITGASSGIGAACAEAFVEQGAKVTITGRNETRLHELAKKCQQIGPPGVKVLSLAVDHSKEEDNVRTVEETIAEFGRLDVLVNNAGFGLPGSIEESSMENFDNVIQVNVRAPYQLTKLAILHLRKTKGNIINMSSILGILAMPSFASYNMSKSALDNLTKTTALEVAADGIRVNSVNPGYIVTNFFKNSKMTDEQVSEFEGINQSANPLGRNGKPRDVADAVLFLASDKASFITGSLLSVDGGRSAKVSM